MISTPSAAWAFRLREVLGAPFEEIEEQHLRSLIENGVREDADLDFKQAGYGGGDSAKRELAGDIASMANERGGLIVIGIRDEEDIAAELTPVQINDGEEARFRLTVASNVAPHIPFDVHVVAAANRGRGYYLLVVPPSTLRPHAVRKDIDLRYPRRNGTTTRWLSEPEVADMYRDRFSAITDQISRAESILREGVSRLETKETEAYLVVALVPPIPGRMTIDQARIRQIEEWAADQGGIYYWRGFFGGRPTALPGLRRVALSYGFGASEQPRMPYAELHSDACGFACEKLSHPISGGMGPQNLPRVPILDFHLLWGVARCLRLLGRHAVENTGSWGDALVAAHVLGKDVVLTYLAEGGMFEEAVTTRSFHGPIESDHTLLLESLAGPDQDLLASARLVATDIVNALGSPEIAQVDHDGRIRTRYVKNDQQFVSFVEECGVETTEERVPRG